MILDFNKALCDQFLNCNPFEYLPFLKFLHETELCYSLGFSKIPLHPQFAQN